MSTQALRAINREILEISEEILRAAEPPIDPQILADLRRRAALASSRFFAEQERALLQPLRASADPDLVAIARNCVARDLEGRQLALAHYQRWPLARIAEDPAVYRADVLTMVRWMEGRTLYAEQSAYPALARFISSTKQPSAA